MPTADFEPTKQVLLVFLDVVGRGRLGSVFVFVFPFLWFCVGGSVWVTIFIGVQPPAKALRVLHDPHCPYVPGWWLQFTSLCHPLLGP